MAVPVIDKFCFLDPYLLAKRLQAARGDIVVDKWGLLDQTRMEAEIESAADNAGAFRHKHINDPHWTPGDLADATTMSVI